MRKPIIAGNWKMYKSVKESVKFAKQLNEKFKGIQDREIVIAPTFIATASVIEPNQPSFSPGIGCKVCDLGPFGKTSV